MINVEIDVKGMREVAQDLQRLGVRIIPITHEEIREDLEALKQSVSETGERPTYPINWDSERQRRAYFATDGFGHGIPYRRTGRYENAWRIVRTGQGYRLENPLPFAVYVSGDESGQSQSRIHQGRWPLWSRKIDDALSDINRDAEREIENEARRWGF